MSLLSVTKVQTANGTTDLTVTTGNSATGGMVVQSNGNAVILQSNSTANAVYIYSSGDVKLGFNNQKLAFTAKSGADVYFIQQNDDNFVFYSTNSTSGQRPVFSIFANSDTSNVNYSVPVNVSANLGVTTNTFSLGTSSITASGYSRLPNGLLMQWGTATASVNNATAATANFTVPFNTLYSVNVTLLQANTTAATALAAVANTSNSTSVTWKTTSTAAASSQTMNYLAIGV